jgi:hypothetical protein
LDRLRGIQPKIIPSPTNLPPKPGVINFKGTVAERGSSLRVDYKLVSADQEMQARLPSDTALFAVDKLGFSTRPSAHLLFVDLETKENNLQLAPALIQHFAYRPYNNEWHGKMLRAIDPVLGISVSALPINDHVELGIGGHVGLFDGFITGGVIVDLQGDSFRGRLAIGIDLIDAFTKITN